jgi:hypothetical protein
LKDDHEVQMIVEFPKNMVCANEILYDKKYKGISDDSKILDHKSENDVSKLKEYMLSDDRMLLSFIHSYISEESIVKKYDTEFSFEKPIF